MSTPISTTAAVADLRNKAQAKTLNVSLAHELDASGQCPDILVIAAEAPASDAGCLFLVPVAGRGVFTRAGVLKLNNVPGFIGPAPNERLGVIDVLFTSDMVSDTDASYDGLKLFTDILADKKLDVYCESLEKTEHYATAQLSKMQFARMTVYDAPVDKELLRLAGGNAMFAGARLRLNGADAIVAGDGCRSTQDKPSLALIADLFPMKPDFILTDENGSMDRHNMVFAIPMASVADPESLLKRAAELVAARGADAEKLAKAEKDLAEALLADSFHQADPGPQSV
ncbi:MAG: hypothetical protein IJ474_05310 [Mailhella sp.]|nr:hypothetical protein [Mailhella sp.]